MVPDQREARLRLDAAVRELGMAERELRAAVEAAHLAGVGVVELAELTGRHRNTIRAWLRSP